MRIINNLFLSFTFLLTSWSVNAQVYLVEDSNPGDCGSIKCGVSPEDLIILNDTLYYTGYDLGFDRKIWMYAETGPPTMILPSLYDEAFNLKAFDSLILFQGIDVNGAELWKFTQGNGLELVADIHTGVEGSFPNHFVEYKDKIYFSATSTSSSDLWSYDPSNGSVQNIAQSLVIDSPRSLVIYNDTLYFSASDDGTLGFELWKFDGVSQPSIVYDLNQSTASSLLSPLIVFDGKLICSGNDGVIGNELWAFDGVNPPALIEDINPGSSGSSPQTPVLYNGQLYFVADNGVNGRELWSYDGLNNPVMVADIHIGVNSSFIEHIQVYNNVMYFNAENAFSNTELWKYDGINSPELFYEINLGLSGSYPKFFKKYRDKVFFGAYDDLVGDELRMLSTNVNHEEGDKERLLYFPNPTSDILKVTGLLQESSNEARIMNAIGKIVTVLKINENIIDVSELSRGVYFIQIESSVIRIVKE